MFKVFLAIACCRMQKLWFKCAIRRRYQMSSTSRGRKHCYCVVITELCLERIAFVIGRKLPLECNVNSVTSGTILTSSQEAAIEAVSNYGAGLYESRIHCHRLKNCNSEFLNGTDLVRGTENSGQLEDRIKVQIVRKPVHNRRSRMPAHFPAERS